MPKRSRHDAGRCVACVGLITDTQYADREARPGRHGAAIRCYRTDSKVREAAKAFAASTTRHVVHLGDLIDGCNVTDEERERAKVLMLEALRDHDVMTSPWTCHYVVGNDDVSNFSRAQLAAWTRPRSDGASGAKLFYRSFVPTAGWRIVLLDTTEFMCPDKPVGWDLTPGAGQHVASDGALGEDQLAWLQQTLAASAAASERVVVCGHNPCFGPVSRHADACSWDADPLLSLLASAPARVVVAYIAGHDHQGGYAYDDGAHGLHHLTVPSLLEHEAARYLTMQLWDDGSIVLQGACDVLVSHRVESDESGARSHGATVSHEQRLDFACGVRIRRGSPCEVLPPKSSGEEDQLLKALAVAGPDGPRRWRHTSGGCAWEL